MIILKWTELGTDIVFSSFQTCCQLREFPDVRPDGMQLHKKQNCQSIKHVNQVNYTVWRLINQLNCN